MALNKDGMDLKAIDKDQKAIDRLPNKGRASVDHSKSAAKKKELAKKIKQPSKEDISKAIANEDSYRSDSKARAYTHNKSKGYFK